MPARPTSAPDDLDPADAPEEAIARLPLRALLDAATVQAQMDRAIAFGARIHRDTYLARLPVGHERRAAIGVALLQLPAPADRPTVGGEVA